jgi:hypothetical protein
LQRLRQTAGDIKVTDTEVMITGLTIWDPPSLDLKTPTVDEFEGHGVPPSEEELAIQAAAWRNGDR